MEKWFDQVELQIAVQVIIASFLSLVIGIEREKANKAAGMRTNMIVGGISCLLILLGKPLIGFVSDGGELSGLASDPIRIIESIIVGISFIGAGTILKDREGTDIKGLTTAATLLYSSGVGICVALEFYALAIIMTVFILLVNYLLNLFAKKYTPLK